MPGGMPVRVRALIGHPLRLEQDGIVRGGYGPLAAERRGLPGEEIELRATAHGQFYGRFMMTPQPGAHPSRRARLAAVTLADLAGQHSISGQASGQIERTGDVHLPGSSVVNELVRRQLFQ